MIEDYGNAEFGGKLALVLGNEGSGISANLRDQLDQALTIPLQAVVEEDDERFVYVVKNDEVERRRVELGIEYLNDIEILDGLSADERVVVVGQSSLRDGARVLAQAPAADRYTG